MTMTRMTMTRRVMFRRMGWTGTRPAPGPTESSGGRAQQGHDEKAAAPPGAAGSPHLTPTTRRPCRRPPPWNSGRRPSSSSPRVRGAARSATEKSRRPRCSADRRCSNCSHRSVPVASSRSHTRSKRTTTPALYENADVLTMSNRLDRRFFFPMLLCLRKNFWAWLATCVGVLVVT